MFFNDWWSQVENNPDYNPESCKKRLKWLLWDFDLKRSSWNGLRRTVVQRVIELGKMEDYLSIFCLYGGYEGVRQIIKDEVPVLSPKEISFVCALFNINRKELKCYNTIQSKERHWIY